MCTRDNNKCIRKNIRLLFTYVTVAYTHPQRTYNKTKKKKC